MWIGLVGQASSATALIALSLCENRVSSRSLINGKHSNISDQTVLSIRTRLRIRLRLVESQTCKLRFVEVASLA